MERSTFSEDNSVPFRIRSSLLSNLILTVRAVKNDAAGKSGITSCLPTNRPESPDLCPARRTHSRPAYYVVKEIRHLARARQSAQITVDHHPVETVVYKEQQAAKQPRERFHRSPSRVLVFANKIIGHDDRWFQNFKYLWLVFLPADRADEVDDAVAPTSRSHREEPQLRLP
jgi:hypothetical protein